MSVETAIFDRTSFLKRMLGDWDLCLEIIGDFLDDLPNQLQELYKGAAQGDLVTVARRAHTIKGASSNVSAEALRAAAIALELAATEGNTEQLPPLLKRLRAEAENIRQVMEAARASRT